MNAKRVTLLAILGQHKLYVTLSNFLGIIGYWGGDLHAFWLINCILTFSTSLGAWVSAVCVEHLYFRRADFSFYDLKCWNVPSRLPLGVAALGASILSFALVIPCMSQVWYQGPIASKTGDLGFESAMVVTALCYIPLRQLELRWRGN
jgi:purine-cytosine permease-like protein